MTSPIKDHMLVDPRLQQEIMSRIEAAHLPTGQPSHVVNALGSIAMPDGKWVPVYSRHAVDPILLDEAGNVVLITRSNEPGTGLEALPGGFIDPIHNGDGIVTIEPGYRAALREAMEETGISWHILAAAKVTPVGHRIYNRPFDIRQAWGNISGTPIRKGDLFAVSTQGFRVQIKGDLSTIALQAGDDASKVRVEQVSALRPEDFAVPDHLPMILQAVAGREKRNGRF